VAYDPRVRNRAGAMGPVVVLAALVPIAAHAAGETSARPPVRVIPPPQVASYGSSTAPITQQTGEWFADHRDKKVFPARRRLDGTAEVRLAENLFSSRGCLHQDDLGRGVVFIQRLVVGVLQEVLIGANRSGLAKALLNVRAGWSGGGCRGGALRIGDRETEQNSGVRHPLKTAPKCAIQHNSIQLASGPRFGVGHP